MSAQFPDPYGLNFTTSIAILVRARDDTSSAIETMAFAAPTALTAEIEAAVHQIMRALRIGVDFVVGLVDAFWPESDGLHTTFLEPFTTSLADLSQMGQVLAHMAGVAAGSEHTIGYRESQFRASASALTDFMEKLGRAARIYRDYLPAMEIDRQERDANQRFIDGVIELIEAKNVAYEIQQVKAAAQTTLESTLQAAGSTASAVLGAHFKEYGRIENRQVSIFRGVTIGLLMATATGTALILLLTDTSDFLRSVLKVLAFSPLAILAAYTGREGSKHQKSARWAAELHAQLMTFDAFSASLSKEVSDQLRLDFGRRLFGSRADGDQHEPGPGLLTEMGTLVGQIAEAIRRGPDERPKSGPTSESGPQ